MQVKTFVLTRPLSPSSTHHPLEDPSSGVAALAFLLLPPAAAAVAAPAPPRSLRPHTSASARTRRTPRCLVTRSFSSLSRWSAGKALSADALGGVRRARSDVRRGVRKLDGSSRIARAESICYIRAKTSSKTVRPIGCAMKDSNIEV